MTCYKIMEQVYEMGDNYNQGPPYYQLGPRVKKDCFRYTHLSSPPSAYGSPGAPVFPNRYYPWYQDIDGNSFGEGTIAPCGSPRSFLFPDRKEK